MRRRRSRGSTRTPCVWCHRPYVSTRTMNPLRTHVDMLADAIKRRDATAYAELAAQLDQAQVPAVAASIAFAFLHMTLASSATAFMQKKIAVTCSAQDAAVVLAYTTRAAMCRCVLHGGVIEALYLLNGQLNGAVSFSVPATTDQAALVAFASSVAKDVIDHVTGFAS